MGGVSIDDVLDSAHWAAFSSSWLGTEQSALVGAGGGGAQNFGSLASAGDLFGQSILGMLEPDDQTKSLIETSPFPQDSPLDDQNEDHDDSPAQALQSPNAEPSSSNTGGAKSKKTGKIIETKNVSCTKCNSLIAKLVLRGTREELDLPFDMLYQCLNCAPPESISPSGSGKSGSGSRKRANELDDTEKFVNCDVCTHVKGHGGLRVRSREMIEFTAEVSICITRVACGVAPWADFWCAALVHLLVVLGEVSSVRRFGFACFSRWILRSH